MKTKLYDQPDHINNLMQFIINFRNWKTVLAEEPYYLIIKEDPDLPNIYLFKYNQHASDMSNIICQEARGIILEIIEDTLCGDQDAGEYLIRRVKLLCHSFDKFFNYSEEEGQKLLEHFDWSNYSFQEKRDGSLLRMWYYKDKWRVSTSGTIDAHKATIDIPSCPYTSFGDMFQRIFASYDEDLRVLSENITYSFEMTSPNNKIVVDYSSDELTLIGLRDNILNIELDIYGGYNLFKNIKVPIKFEYSSIDQSLEEANKIKNFEGLVLCDVNFNRVKIKTDKYLVLHKLADATSSDRGILRLVLENKIDDVKNRLPHINYRIERVENYIKEETEAAMEVLNSIFVHEYDRKAIAQQLRGNRFMGFVFRKIDFNPIKEYFKVDNLEKIYKDYKIKYNVKDEEGIE